MGKVIESLKLNRGPKLVLSALLVGCLAMSACKKASLRVKYRALRGEWTWVRSYYSSWNDITFESESYYYHVDDTCNCYPSPRSLNFQKGNLMVLTNGSEVVNYYTTKSREHPRGFRKEGGSHKSCWLYLEKEQGSYGEVKFTIDESGAKDTLIIKGFFPVGSWGQVQAGGAWGNGTNYFVRVD